MNFLKTFAIWLYTTLGPQADRAKEGVALLTEAEKANLLVAYLTKDAPLLYRDTPEYKAVLAAAKNFLALNYNSNSFASAAQSVVRSTVSPAYFLTTAITNLIYDHLNATATGLIAGDEGERLLKALQPILAEAALIKNPIKRRALVREAIKGYVPDLASDKAALLIELVLAV